MAIVLMANSKVKMTISVIKLYFGSVYSMQNAATNVNCHKSVTASEKIQKRCITAITLKYYL